MTKYLSIAVLLVFLAGCQTDASRQKAFAGKYDVSIKLSEAQEEMIKAKKETKEEMAKAQQEIKDEIKKAKKEIDEEMGEDNDFGKAVGNFVEGMGNLAQGLTGLGEELAGMGIDLGQGILEGIHFKAEFKEDGNVLFGKKSKIRIGSGDGNFWEIKDGKFYLWENENDKTEFEMKETSKGNWDLIGEKVTLQLEKIEK